VRDATKHKYLYKNTRLVLGPGGLVNYIVLCCMVALAPWFLTSLEICPPLPPFFHEITIVFGQQADILRQALVGCPQIYSNCLSSTPSHNQPRRISTRTLKCTSKRSRRCRSLLSRIPTPRLACSPKYRHRPPPRTTSNQNNKLISRLFAMFHSV
jgi:hypothetical protein